jgi:tetratricopeptide (TPR) repeat protein
MTLWSTSYQRPVDEAAALQDQAATDVADGIAGMQDLGPDANDARPEVLRAYLSATDVGRRTRGNFEASREAFRQLVAVAPESARAHAIYSVMITAALTNTRPPADTRARWQAEAKAEADKAIALKPKDGFGYAALVLTLPKLDFLGRDAVFQKALNANPDSAILLDNQANHLRSVGRLAEGLAVTQGSLALGAPRPSRVSGLIFSFAGAGRYADAEALGERQAQLTPTNNSTRRANLFTALNYAPPDKAAVAIDRFQLGQPRLDPVSEAAWRTFIAARAGKVSPSVAAKALSAAPRGEYSIDPSTVMSAYSQIGRLDEAFAELAAAVAEDREIYIANLFEAAGANMRRDPRFMPTAVRLGLVAYWQKTGHWPDFCQAPDRPYDCKAAAQAALKAAPAG